MLVITSPHGRRLSGHLPHGLPQGDGLSGHLFKGLGDSAADAGVVVLGAGPTIFMRRSKHGGHEVYPLVNIQKAMENHHF